MDQEVERSRGRLAGKVALIAGAGSGIGRATAMLLARSGGKIVAIDRNPESAQETVDLLGDRAGEWLAVCADVSQEREVAAAVASTLELFGHLDVLVNNAAIELALPITETTAEQ